MKTSFKTLLIAIALLIGVTANAQDKPLTFGVKAGMNLSNFSGDVDDTSVKIGFNFGITADYALTPELYILTGLEFTMKGSKADGTLEGVKVTEKANPMFLQLPVHLGYKFAVANDTRIVLHAGPYIAYGIGGKLKYEAKQSGVTGSVDTDFFGDDRFKRFDFGLGLGAGVEFGKIGVGLGCDFGLVSLARGDAKVRTMNAYLTVGYKF